MWSEEQIIEYIKSNLNNQRFQHSLRVQNTAVELAHYYKTDIEKTSLAGLVHDCAKNMEISKMLYIIEKNGYNIDIKFKNNSNIMHGLAGAIVAETVMGIADREVLDAVAYHTTGKANMTMLQKIIYLADYIEPMRNFPGVEELRQLAYKDLDKALLLSFNNTIKYVIDKNEFIHSDTIEARNYLMYNMST